MKRIVGLFIIFLLAFPYASIAGEPAWWTQKKRECGLSSSLAYNTWESQGSPCNKGGGSSGGSSPSGDLGTALGQVIGNAIADSIRKNQEEAARLNAEGAARAAEERRRQEEETLKRHEEMKDRLLGSMMGVGEPSQLGLMGADSGSSGLSLMTDEQMMTGKVQLLRSPEEIENQKGGRYIDCDSTRQFYDRASSSLSSQKDAIERTRAQIDSAKRAKLEHGKELRKVLLKGGFDTARDMLFKSKMLQKQIDGILKKGGLSDKQRKALYDATSLLNDTYEKVERNIKEHEAGDKFPEEFKQAKGFKESYLALNKLLADSGTLDETGKSLATGFGPMGLLLYDASKLALDAGVVKWEKDIIDESDLQQAQNTYDNLKYQLSQMQEKLDNARADLTTNCSSGQSVVVAP